MNNPMRRLIAGMMVLCANLAYGEGTFELREGTDSTDPIFLEGSLTATNFDQYRVTFLRVDILDPDNEVIDFYGQDLGSPDIQVWCPGGLPIPTPDAGFTLPTPDYTAELDASNGEITSFAEVVAVQDIVTRPRPPRTYELTGPSASCGDAGAYTIRYASAGQDSGGQQFFDVRVRNTDTGVLETGRVWADKLAFSLNSFSTQVGSQLYVVAGEDRGADYLGITWLLDLNDISPFGFQLYANRRGVGPAEFNYKSMGGAASPTPTMDPLFPIYFNPPAKPVTVPGILGAIDSIETQCTPGGATDVVIRFDVAGELPYALRVDENGNNQFDPGEVVASGISNDGTNTIVWDGTLPSGATISAGNSYPIQITLTTGEVHFPFFDVEDADPGPIITPFNVPASATTDRYYWDDTDPSVTTTAAGGTSSGADGSLATHDWANGLNDYADANIIDTWKYADVQFVDDVFVFPASCAADPVIALAKDAATTADNGDGSVELALDFRVENLGNVDLQNVQITDDIAAALPPPVSWSITSVSTSAPLTANPGFDGSTDTSLLDATASTLPLGEIGEVTVVLDVDFNGETGPFTNTATATADDGSTPVSDISQSGTDPDPDGDGDPVENDPTPLPVAESDLEVTKVIDNPAPFVGETVTWTVTATNAGPVTETDAAITETLPAGFSVASVTPSDGSWSAPVWTLPTLTPGQSETLTIVGSFSTDGSFDNVAELTAATNPDPDSTPGNGQPAEDDQAVSTAIAVPLADISVAKSDGGVSVVPGTNVTYQIQVANAGPSPVNGVELNDPTPAGLSLVGVTAPCAGGLPCTLPMLNPGDSIMVEVTFSVPPDYSGSDPISNIANITSPVDDPDAGNDSSTDTTPLAPAEADLAVAKVVDDASPNVGSDVTFTVDVVNNGPSNATGVEVLDVLPTGYAFVSATPSQGGYDDGTGVWTVGALADGATASLQIVATVLDAGDHLNSASVSGNETDPDGSNNDDDASVEPAPVADLAVSKSDDGASVVPGTDVTYTITVDNLGPSAADNVVVSDPAPTGLTLVSASPPCGSLPCNLGTIAADGSESFTVTFAVPSDYSGPDPISNTASVASDTDDPDGDNNSATDTTPVDAPVADLALTKTDGDAEAVVGESVSYTLEVSNLGPSRAEAVIVDDPTPAGLVLQSVSGACSAMPCAIGDLEVGASATVVVTYDIGLDYSGPDPIVNIASVDSDTHDPEPANDSDTESTPVDNSGVNPAIGVAKAVTGISGDNPFDVVFRMTVTNYGNVTLDQVQLVDDLSGVFPPAVAVEVQDITADAPLAANPGYDGQSDINLLNVAASTLAPGQTATVDLALRLTISGVPGVYENSAVASGSSPDDQITEDTSTNGLDPDPDDDGDPGGPDEDQPTPLEPRGLQAIPVPMLDWPAMMLLLLGLFALTHLFGSRLHRV